MSEDTSRSVSCCHPCTPAFPLKDGDPETKALDERLHAFGAHLEYAELAVQSLIALGSTLLYSPQFQEAQGKYRLRSLIDRLLRLNKLIKKRYETKTMLLYKVAHFLFEIGDQDAVVYFEQAEKFYAQQLAYLEGWSVVEPVKQIRERVRAQLGTLERTHPTRLKLEADTPEELERFLSTLEKHLPGIRITRPIRQERTSNSTRAGFRATAIITWTSSSPSMPAPTGDINQRRNAGRNRSKHEGG